MFLDDAADFSRLQFLASASAPICPTWFRLSSPARPPSPSCWRPWPHTPFSGTRRQLTTRQRQLFNFAMFIVASGAGQVVLRQHYRPLVAHDPRHRRLMSAWVLLYSFVAVQIALGASPIHRRTEQCGAVSSQRAPQRQRVHGDSAADWPGIESSHTLHATSINDPSRSGMGRKRRKCLASVR